MRQLNSANAWQEFQVVKREFQRISSPISTSGTPVVLENKNEGLPAAGSAEIHLAEVELFRHRVVDDGDYFRQARSVDVIMGVKSFALY